MRSICSNNHLLGYAPRAAVAALGLMLGAGPASADASPFRVATYNTRLVGVSEGSGVSRFASPGDLQANFAAEVIQRLSPDVLLINEFDYEPSGQALAGFQANYLNVSQRGLTPINYTGSFLAESNTGLPSGFDLDNNGQSDGPGDAYGFGDFPGQYGMALLTKPGFTILTDQVRTFQQFLWKDMPGNVIPAGYYTPEELDIFRLSSKSHWDIPVMTPDGDVVHFLASHPTPPVFDGAEDRNGRRNHDEIRFWADYVTPGQGGYIYDDQQWSDAGDTTPLNPEGGLAPGANFVILGDQNADPDEGDSFDNAILQLLDSPEINGSFVPVSSGTTDPSDTASFGLRADYVLPSAEMDILDGAVFWPSPGDPQWLAAQFTSDHRPVYLDLVVPEPTTGLLLGAGLLLVRRRRG